ncbi:MAG: hypothetical protein JWQ96_3108 [Segetibacter sp.]|nr:hypothetical protein [Segetibacter sp.]
MNRALLSILVIIFFASTTQAQSAEDSVKQVVNKMFAAMKGGEGTALKSCFNDSAFLQTIVTTKDGKTSVRNENIDAFIKQITALPKDAADERIKFDMVKVDGGLASVWTPYQFYYNGNFSHCGVNSFQLVRINGEWKIQYIIDTRRKDNCK